MLIFRLENPSTADAPARILLEGDATVESVAELKTALLGALEGHHRVTVDCAGATGLDLTALQLFCAAHRTAISLGKEFRLSGCQGDLFDQVFQETGFRRIRACLHSPDSHLCLWVAPEAA